MKKKQKDQYQRINQSMINTLTYNREVMNDINKSFNDPQNKKKPMTKDSKKQENSGFDIDSQ